jgi:hypothetical protein
MHFLLLVAVLVQSLRLVAAGTINLNKVAPMAQPTPTTSAQKAAVKFKPRLAINGGSCVSFPAVDSAGETSSGLPGTGSSTACTKAPLGSQVYGRAAQFNGKFAILYAWYFPKGFWNNFATRRHDWASAVVWIDDPEAAAPSITGLSVSMADWKYKKQAPASSGITDGTTPRLLHRLEVDDGYPYLQVTDTTGDFQPLIMWDQLPVAARTALNTTDFGVAKVPVSDANFENKLMRAWPF